jgi:hypothetical protein
MIRHALAACGWFSQVKKHTLRAPDFFKKIYGVTRKVFYLKTNRLTIAGKNLHLSDLRNGVVLEI